MSTVVDPIPATPLAPATGLTKDTYKNKVHPDWCPGCGDFSVLAALQTALLQFGDVAVCADLRDRLCLQGFAPVAIADYDLMLRWDTEARAAGYAQPA